MQGKISGTDWIYKSGLAEPVSSDNSLNVNIYDIDPDGGDPCGIFPFTGANNVLLMSFPESTGLYTLGSSRTITLYDSYTNYILTEGKFEILTIDSIGMVTGRIAAGYNSNNYINGNFSVTYCP